MPPRKICSSCLGERLILRMDTHILMRCACMEVEVGIPLPKKPAPDKIATKAPGFKTELDSQDHEKLSLGFSVLVGPHRYHRCSACGTIGQWSEAWSWHGSMRDIDEGRPVLKACSQDCAQQLPKKQS
jgi:hypothetical protein